MPRMSKERQAEVVAELRRVVSRYDLWSKTSARRADRERDAAIALLYRDAADELEAAWESEGRLAARAAELEAALSRIDQGLQDGASDPYVAGETTVRDVIAEVLP